MVKKVGARLLLVGFFLAVLQKGEILCRNEIEPDTTNLWSEYVQIVHLIKAKEYERAISGCRQLIARQPEFRLAYKAFVQAHSGKGELDGATLYFQNLLTEKAENAFAYYGLGLTYLEKKDYVRAVDHFRKCIGLSPQFVPAVSGLVDAYEGEQKLDEGLLYMQQLIQSNEKNSAAHYGLGTFYYLKKEAEKALKYLDQALKLDGELMEAYRMKGKIFYEAANFNQCIEVFENLLSLAMKKNDVEYEGHAHHWIATASERTGDYPKAIDHSRLALEKQEQIGFRQGEGATLNEIGNIYNTLGDYPKATHYYLRAREVWRAIGDKKGEGTVLFNIGVVHMMEEKYRKARTYYKAALKIRREIPDKAGEGNTLNNLGITYAREANYGRARAYLEQALTVRRQSKQIRGEAITLNHLGDIYRRLGDYQNAIDCQRKALEIAETVHHRETIWRAYSSLATTFEKQGQLNEALNHFQAAIRTLEEIRGGLLGEDQKAGYFQNKLKVYENIINLLCQLHQINPANRYDQLAFAYTERGKARAFLDLLAESKAEVRKGITDRQLEEERAVSSEISTIQLSLSRANRSADAKKRLQDDLYAAERKLEKLKEDLRRTNPKYANLRYPEPDNLQNVQQNIIRPGELVLEYTLGDERSYLFSISKDSFKIVPLPKRRIIEAAVMDYLGLINKNPEGPAISESLRNVYAQGRRLYKLLLGQDKLPKSSTLIVLPDGVLHYLPFEVLIKGEVSNIPTYLLNEHEIAYAPSASVWGLMRQETDSNMKTRGTQERELLAFGDPDPSELWNGMNKDQDSASRPNSPLGPRLTRLPYTRIEVESIARLYPVEKTKRYLGKQATESAFKREDLSIYRYIHLATHGIINERFPSSSGVVLGSDSANDGLLQMREIFNLNLNAELVVLSSCESGLGKMMKGEGLMSMTRSFLYAGARNILVSLWKVRDETTAELMKLFYESLKKGIEKPAALRQAKINFLTSPRPTWRHPYYWAPFVLIGKS